MATVETGARASEATEAARPDAGASAPGGLAPPRFVRRFTVTERALHWIHASAFFVLLGSGLVLYLPTLSDAIGRRPLIKDIHFWTGISWAGALVLVALAGWRFDDRRALRRTLRELDLFDRDDLHFLRGDLHAPQGRFNAGQKVNAIVTAAFAVLFFASGLLLWIGERNTDIRLAGTIYLHDVLMYASVAIVLGHLYLALLNPSTRHSLRGMVLGSVRADWAATHHSKWRQDPTAGADRDPAAAADRDLRAAADPAPSAGADHVARR